MTLHLDVVTPRGTAVSTETDEVVAPGKLGEFGILPGHTALLAAIKPGVLRWRRGQETLTLAVGSGFLEVSGAGRVVVLAEKSARPEEIDAAAAERELADAERAEKEAAGRTTLDSTEHADLEARRAWAQARLAAKPKH